MAINTNAAFSDSSPHTRRYFHITLPQVQRSALFSAHAEVFPPALNLHSSCGTLFRPRGGIS